MLTELRPAEAVLPQEVIHLLKVVRPHRGQAVQVPAILAIPEVQAAAVQGLQVLPLVLPAVRVLRVVPVPPVVQDQAAAPAAAVEEGINKQT